MRMSFSSTSNARRATSCSRAVVSRVRTVRWHWAYIVTAPMTSTMPSSNATISSIRLTPDDPRIVCAEWHIAWLRSRARNWNECGCGVPPAFQRTATVYRAGTPFVAAVNVIAPVPPGNWAATFSSQRARSAVAMAFPPASGRHGSPHAYALAGSRLARIRSARSAASVTACVRCSASWLIRRLSRYRVAMPSIPTDSSNSVASTSSSVKPVVLELAAAAQVRMVSCRSAGCWTRCDPRHAADPSG